MALAANGVEAEANGGLFWLGSLCLLFLVNSSCEVVICVYVMGFAPDQPVKLACWEVALFISPQEMPQGFDVCNRRTPLTMVSYHFYLPTYCWCRLLHQTSQDIFSRRVQILSPRRYSPFSFSPTLPWSGLELVIQDNSMYSF